MAGYAEITLDLCCCEGGGAHGLVQAGHYVVGVDIDGSCRDGYLRSGAHEFIQADAMAVLRDRGFMDRFTFTSAHPPCQAKSGMTRCRPGVAGTYPQLIRPFQPLLDAWAAETGGVFVIENVEGARDDLRDPVTFCMWMFGRPGYRHRLFEAGGGLVLTPPPAPAWAWSPPSAAYQRARTVRRDPVCGWPHPVPTARAGHWKPELRRFVSAAGHERRDAMLALMELSTRPDGWMSDREAVAEAIPPYLGSEIARQLAAWRAGQEAAA